MHPLEVTVKTITLRNLPSELAEKIEQEAARTNASLNATVIRLLQETLGGDSQGKTDKKRDLSGLGGGWTKEEADAFDRHVAELRQIDPEMWESAPARRS